MVKVNSNLTQLKANYFFKEIEKHASLLKEKKRALKFFNLGIGDVTKPLSSSFIEAFSAALQELSHEKTMKGYGPSQGEFFLRQTLIKHEYKDLNINEDEVFISCGTKNDIASIEDLFCKKNIIAIPDPTYPVYVDSNVLAGKTKGLKKNQTYKGIVYLPCLEENNFFPLIPKKSCDLIYLCSPSNPTGIAFTKEQLTQWVNYAKENNAIILYDGAYEAFISSPNIPKSIYEIPHAKDVAIEFRSFSKTAGLTGVRLSYYILPKTLKTQDNLSLHALWKRRVETKYGGTSYPLQKGALAFFSERGQIEIKKNLSHYKDNAHLLRIGLSKLGYTIYGGEDSPYIWCKTPNKKLSSWAFFDQLLNQGIICIPGRGFGPSGEGFVRFSSFAKREDINQALEILKKLS